MDKYYYYIDQIAIEQLENFSRDSSSYLSYLPRDMINIVKNECRGYYNKIDLYLIDDIDDLRQEMYKIPTKHYYITFSSTDFDCEIYPMLTLELIDIDTLLFETIINDEIKFCKLKYITEGHYRLINSSLSLEIHIRYMWPIFIYPYKNIRTVFNEIFDIYHTELKNDTCYK